MDQGVLWGLYGILATIIVGWIGVKLSYNSKKISKVNLLFLDAYSLINSIVDQLPNLEIKYKEKKVTRNIIVFRYALINQGNVDIGKNQIFKQLTVTTPKEFKILELSIEKSSHQVNAALIKSQDNQSFIVDWDLLKPNEYIKIICLLDYEVENPKISLDSKTSIAKHFLSQMKLDYRFERLEKIDLVISGRNLLNNQISQVALSILQGFILSSLLIGYFRDENILRLIKSIPEMTTMPLIGFVINCIFLILFILVFWRLVKELRSGLALQKTLDNLEE